MLKHWLRRLHTALIALALALVPLGTGVKAADDPHKVAVVSFGLFGDQRVFQSEATGAAQIVAGHFSAEPTIVKFNNKKGGDATTASLAATLRATGKNMDDGVLFLILTSHGSPDGLAVVAGRRQETLTPAHLADMLNATHVRYRAVVTYRPAIPACSYRGSLTRIAWSSRRPTRIILPSAARIGPNGPISATPFSTLRCAGRLG